MNWWAWLLLGIFLGLLPSVASLVWWSYVIHTMMKIDNEIVNN